MATQQQASDSAPTKTPTPPRSPTPASRTCKMCGDPANVMCVCRAPCRIYCSQACAERDLLAIDEEGKHGHVTRDNEVVLPARVSAKLRDLILANDDVRVRSVIITGTMGAIATTRVSHIDAAPSAVVVGAAIIASTMFRICHDIASATIAAAHGAAVLAAGVTESDLPEFVHGLHEALYDVDPSAASEKKKGEVYISAAAADAATRKKTTTANTIASAAHSIAAGEECMLDPATARAVSAIADSVSNYVGFGFFGSKSSSKGTPKDGKNAAAALVTKWKSVYAAVKEVTTEATSLKHGLEKAKQQQHTTAPNGLDATVTQYEEFYNNVPKSASDSSKSISGPLAKLISGCRTLRVSYEDAVSCSSGSNGGIVTKSANNDPACDFAKIAAATIDSLKTTGVGSIQLKSIIETAKKFGSVYGAYVEYFQDFCS